MNKNVVTWEEFIKLPVTRHGLYHRSWIQAFECPKVKFQAINRPMGSWSSWGKLPGADRGVTQVPQPSWLHSCHPDGGCGHHKQVLQCCPGHYIPRPSPTNHPVTSHALNMTQELPPWWLLTCSYGCFSYESSLQHCRLSSVVWPKLSDASG